MNLFISKNSLRLSVCNLESPLKLNYYKDLIWISFLISILINLKYEFSSILILFNICKIVLNKRMQYIGSSKNCQLMLSMSFQHSPGVWCEFIFDKMASAEIPMNKRLKWSILINLSNPSLHCFLVRYRCPAEHVLLNLNSDKS